MSAEHIPSALSQMRLTPYVASVIIVWRQLSGMTQVELAEKAGLSASALKKIEAGRKRNACTMQGSTGIPPAALHRRGRDDESRIPHVILY